MGRASARKGLPIKWTSKSSEFSIAITFTSSDSWSTRSRNTCTSVAPNRIARLVVSDSGKSAPAPASPHSLPRGLRPLCGSRASSAPTSQPRGDGAVGLPPAGMAAGWAAKKAARSAAR